MNIAVFASGRGSNLQAILDAIGRGVLSSRLCAVISNASSAGALEIARAHSVPALHLNQQQFPNERAFSAAMLSTLEKHRTEFVALAGYLKKVPREVIERYRNRIVNIHPALLPSFGGPGMYGHRVHEAVIASGVKVTGASVHVVDEEYDRGSIVLQKAVAVTEEDDASSIAAKVLKIEHEIYPEALKAFEEGRVHFNGNRVWIRSSGRRR